ncbi:hypothetical protein Adt_41919 [Abeliophyllum distichum]|uniref:Uncharacterized protein n=1 Tax=Abeliophyllum distichum TaxID=126358 RepID=A0ABD1PQ81_9LAMI
MLSVLSLLYYLFVLPKRVRWKALYFKAKDALRRLISVFDDDFNGLNDIPIPEDIVDQFGGSTDPIDLENVHDDADTKTTIGSSTKRKATKQKAKCWDHFELVPTGKIVNELPEFKVQCKHCQEKFTWQKG